uniref:Uncharacterized protein n=1 Tax=Oryctolagus cuniculus TaxID=9986 RepID=A0A5F9CLN7_RABIT
LLPQHSEIKILTFLFAQKHVFKIFNCCCMRKRELSGSLKHSNAAFSVCLHIFCLFLGLAI